MRLFDLFKKAKKPVVDEKQTNSLATYSGKVVTSEQSNLTVHEDIKGLLWFANGPRRNYEQEADGGVTSFKLDGVVMTIGLSGSVEPSLIDVNLPIHRTNDIARVERPPYYPSYSGLTDDQRGVYWKVLSNPYDESVDIGYIFLLYYGLERHLLRGNFENAFKVILKLRNVHKNKSFQYYSGNALILASIYHQRANLVTKFMDAIISGSEISFSDNLFLLSAYSFDVPLQSKDVINLAKTFEFENKNYISKYPDLFREIMDQIILDRYKKSNIVVRDFVKPSDLNKVVREDMVLFANVSLNGEKIKLPRIVDCFKLKKEMYEILDQTHQTVKSRLAELRKLGDAPQEKKTGQRKKVIEMFDSETEKELLKGLKKSIKNPVDRHFSYIQLQDFYYKFRDLEPKYLQECIKYCKEDINSLNELQKHYIEEKIEGIEKLSSFYKEKELMEHLERARMGFLGVIPAFKRLAIIYEKNKSYTEAIDICDAAIEYYQNINMDTSEFEKRKEKLLKK